MVHSFAAEAERLPRTLDRYELLSVLGTGAFATVYRAQHTLTHQAVAVKVLQRPQDAGPRWLAEARAAASIQHPNVVRVLDCGQTDGQVFLVMDLAEGPTLAGVLEHGPLPVQRAVDVALQVLDGLSAAHARGIVHRDIKPPNIVITRLSDGTEVARILDFGVSKQLARFDTSSTLEGTSIGTPGYMAPELFGDAKTADARADIYAVSAMLYEMLSNRLPFVGRSYEDFVVQAATKRPAPIREVAPHVPSGLAAVIDRGLARDRDARWSGAQEFASALRGGLLGMTPPPSSGAFEPTIDIRTTGQPPPMSSPPGTPSTLRTAPPPVVNSSVRSPALGSSERRSRAIVPVVLGVVAVLAVGVSVGGWWMVRGMHVSVTDTNATEVPATATATATNTAAASSAASSAASIDPTTAATAAAATAATAATAGGGGAGAIPYQAATPAGRGGGIHFKFPPRVVGQVKATAVDGLSRRIIPLAQRCRPAGGAPIVCRVDLFVQAEGKISIAKPGSEPGNEGAAECLATFFKEEANPSNFAPGGGGIVTVEATLDPP